MRRDCATVGFSAALELSTTQLRSFDFPLSSFFSRQRRNSLDARSVSGEKSDVVIRRRFGVDGCVGGEVGCDSGEVDGDSGEVGTVDENDKGVSTCSCGNGK